uniref:Cytochrome c oxidase subunit 2 n=1 Tax=Diversibipalium mayottensis TaxID=3348909 RepID=A0A8K1XU97_9PLAT|nr:cytochrome c oxidase subunit 2 [Diversibipalium sp. MNHN JL281]
MLNSHSPVGKFLDLFHDWSLVILIVISILVFGIIYIFSRNSFCFNDLVESKSLELFWTIVPGLVLLLVITPSLYGLYLLDIVSLVFPSSSVNVGARQWYWSYSYAPRSSAENYGNLESRSVSYDSYMSGYSLGSIRSLDVDLPLVVVSKFVNRLLFSSNDVIHCFALPQLGFKLDCVPGRLNQGYLFIRHVGKFFGQCSEICGANHSFMPIGVECLSNDFDFVSANRLVSSSVSPPKSGWFGFWGG